MADVSARHKYVERVIRHLKAAAAQFRAVKPRGRPPRVLSAKPQELSSRRPSPRLEMGKDQL